MTHNADSLKQAVNKRIAELALAKREPQNLYEPMHYLLGLKGKRVRPVLTMLAYAAASGKTPTDALDLGIAVELFHNFTLMHDDIMDCAPVRRGQPTVHLKWSENIAILSGDALFAYSMELAAGTFPDRAAELVVEYSRVAMGVCEGQMEDLDLVDANSATIPAYLEMIRKKTAVLLGGCLALGGLAAGVSQELVEKMRQFGEALGIAFQLQDDLMDAFPPKGFGKQVGGDIIENKKTYLRLRAYERASREVRSELDQLAAEKDIDQKVKRTLDYYESLGVRAETQSLIDDYFSRASELADELATHIEMKALRQYLGRMMKREV